MDVRICIRPCCGAERVGERHCHRRSGDRRLTKFAEWEEWINLLLGVWVLVSPWVLSFSAQTTARWAHVGIGLIVAVLAGLRLWFMHQTPRQRAGAQR
jgi:hypothetical protein